MLRRQMDEAIEAHRTIKPMTLYRGFGNIAFEKLTNRDGVLRDKAFFSTTRSSSVAREHADGGYVAKVELPAGSPAYAYHKNDPQAEVVLPRGSQFKLVGVDHEKKVWTFAPVRKAKTGDKDFEEGKHKRDGGKFSVSAGAGAAAKPAGRAPLAPAAGTGKDRTHADGSALPPHIAALKLPPAWTDVHYSADPGAALLAQGKDAKGRLQSVYSAAFSATQAKAKFERVKALAIAYPAIAAQNAQAMRSANPKTRDAADCLDLVMQTGIRPGSDDDTGADKKAYGATTLKGEHVVSGPDGTRLQFTGKKGVSLDIKIDDPKLAAALAERAKKAGPDGALFPNVTDKSLLDHTHTMGDGSFRTKDFRTHLGTETAAKMVRSMPVPADAKAHKAAVMTVAKAVAAKLGNTPVVSLQSYIAPEVFSSWGVAHAG